MPIVICMDYGKQLSKYLINLLKQPSQLKVGVVLFSIVKND